MTIWKYITCSTYSCISSNLLNFRLSSFLPLCQINKYFGSKKPKEKTSKYEKRQRKLLKVLAVHEDDDETNNLSYKTSSNEKFSKDEEFSLVEYETKMNKEIAIFEKTLNDLKPGKLSTKTFEGISIAVKGHKIPLCEAAQIVIRSPTLVTFNAFDESHVPRIMQAIRLVDSSWNPQTDSSGVIKLQLPKLTEDTYNSIRTKMKCALEQTKSEIRRHRQKARDDIKIEVTSDIWKSAKNEELQKIVDSKIKAVEAVFARKIIGE